MRENVILEAQGLPIHHECVVSPDQYSRGGARHGEQGQRPIKLRLLPRRRVSVIASIEP